MLSRATSSLLPRSLQTTLRRTKVEYTNNNPYNTRWQFKWRHAYYSEPKEREHNRVKTPEESQLITNWMGSWMLDVKNRILPATNMGFNRRHRMYDNFSVYVLPGSAFLASLFTDVSFGFTVYSLLALGTLYTRIRDKTVDPDLKETYLREMLYGNKEISELFSEETIHVMDYDLEWDKGFPCQEKFPEFGNRLFRFFNTDTSMCTGHFVFGDVESGATMRLDIKTMPIASKYRYQVGEPFFMYDVRAQINHNGVYKEVVLVDEAESLKKYRPYLFIF